VEVELLGLVCRKFGAALPDLFGTSADVAESKSLTFRFNIFFFMTVFLTGRVSPFDASKHSSVSIKLIAKDGQ